MTSSLPAWLIPKSPSLNTHPQHTFYIWSSSPFDVIIRTDLMKKYGPTSIDYTSKQLWFTNDPDNAVPVIADPKTYKTVPVAMITNTTIAPRSSSHIQVQCQSHTPIPNTTIYKMQDNKMVCIPSAITRVEHHHATIVISNWSHQPTILHANTVVGNVTQLYDNPAIAVILETESNDYHDNPPIGQAEAQFENIKTANTDKHNQNKPWYDNITWGAMILTTTQKVLLMTLLTKFANVFSSGPTDIGLTHIVTHRINIPPDATVYQRQYCIPHAYQPLVAEQMDYLFKAGVICPSTS